MAEQKIGIVITGNAATAMEQTATAATNTATQVKSAKQELRELTKAMADMDVNSKEFAAAAARAGQLKDQLNDAADAVKGSTGPAFESMNNTFSVMTGQIANLDFDGLGQSLTSMGRAVSKISFKDLQKELGGLMQGVANLGKALLSNPIFLVGAAIAAVVVYWDDLKTAFDDATMSADKMNKRLMQSEQVLNEMSKADVTAQNLRLLTQAVNDHNLSEETRKKALDKINVALKDNNIQTVDSINNTAQLATSTEQLTQKLFKQAEVQGKMAYLQELWAKRTRLQADVANGVGNTLYKYSFGLDKLAVDMVASTQADIDAVENQIKLVEENLTSSGDFVEQIKLDTQTTTKEVKELNKETKDATTNILELNAIRAASFLKQQKEINDAASAVRAEYAKSQMSAQANELNDLQIKMQQELDSFIGSEEDKVFIVERYRQLEQEINDKYDAIAAAKDEENKQKAQDAREKEWEKDIEFAEKQKKLRQDKLTAETQLKDAEKQLAFASVDLLAAVFQKNKRAADIAFVLQKAMAIGQIVVDTQKEIAGYYANPTWSVLPDGGATIKTAYALGAKIRAATSIASIAASSIGKFMNGGSVTSSGGGGSNPSVSGGMSNQPNPLSFAFLGNRQQQQPPIQAYVVSGQVNTSIEVQTLIRNQAKLH